MAVYCENDNKQTNTLWENRSFLFRVKRESNQLRLKLRLILKIIFAENKVKIAFSAL